MFTTFWRHPDLGREGITRVEPHRQMVSGLLVIAHRHGFRSVGYDYDTAGGNAGG